MTRILNLRGPVFSGKTTALRRRTLGGARIVFVPIKGMDDSFPVTVCDDGVALVGRYVYHLSGKETTADALPAGLLSRVVRAAARLREVHVVMFEGDRISAVAGNFTIPTFPLSTVWAFLDTPVAILRERASGLKFANRSITDQEMAASWAVAHGTRARAEAEGCPTITVPWNTADEFIQQWIEGSDA